MLFAKALTYLPGVGLVGLALYQAINQRDLHAAGSSLVGAAGVFGFGGLLSSLHAKVNDVLGKL
jgi:hypothetical protein